MRKSILCLAAACVLVAVLVLALTPAFAATKKKPPKRVVLGTTQLKGDQAKFGVTYTLGKSAPINVTIDSAAYTVEPVYFGDTPTIPGPKEKLLVIHYTLHNPTKSDRGLSWNTINWQAVDKNDTTIRFVCNTAVEATKQQCNMSLKPAQKTKLYTCIVVPAEGEIPKLIAEGSDRLVLRYDLRDKVKALPAPIADPADATGATAREIVPAELGTFYLLRELQCKVDSIGFFDGKFNGSAARPGQKYLVAHCVAKNTTPIKQGIRWSTFKPKLIDADGGTIPWGDWGVAFESRDDSLNADMEPGADLRFRFLYAVPENISLKSFSINEGNGRWFQYDCTNVK